MKDLKLTNTGDTYDLVETNGDLVEVDGSAELIQFIESKLNVWSAESPYDRTKGVPYRELVFGGHPVEGIALLIQTYLLDINGVVSVNILDKVTKNGSNLAMAPEVVIEDLDQPVTVTVGI